MSSKQSSLTTPCSAAGRVPASSPSGNSSTALPSQYLSMTSPATMTTITGTMAPAAMTGAEMSGPSAQQPTHVQQPQQQQQQQQQPQQQQQQQQHQQQQQAAADNSGSNTAAPYLKDFNLLAEAAKRAQMAVLMRDIDDFTLS